MQDIVVIIPTYNEIENIEAIIKAVLSQSDNIDVLIVDDNSPDKTSLKVKELQNNFPKRLFLEVRKEKSGLGTAYIHGFKWSLNKSYQYIFEMDADFSHNPKDLILLYNGCASSGFDIAIGSRYASGVNVVNWPMGRVLLSYFASLYVQIVTGMPIKDSTAGFICYRREVLQTINLDKIRFVGYAFQIEMKFTSWKFDFKIIEVPIIFTNRVLGESKMSTSILSEAVFGVMAMKLRSIFKNYKRQDPAQS